MSPSENTIIERFDDKVNRALRRGEGGPYVTLTYAQSLDGSITSGRGRTMRLSNPRSQTLTHQLRALHDAILVGINTVLADDPRLNVRFAEGRDPRPVIVDSHLRFPREARLLRGQVQTPLIATTAGACERKEALLRAAGAEVVRLPAQADGLVDLPSLLEYLRRSQVRTVMVEGGARVISSFLCAGLANQLIVTICPMFIGGLRAVEQMPPVGSDPVPRLGNLLYESLEGDLVMMADFLQVPVRSKMA
jgi:3,4-dihydroxy 2-butanone 4-phosphate synthase/GTP cyclohydrolase II